jgi:Tfp pilus assembly protein PilV
MVPCTNKIKVQRGIFLIEVLITTVVVAIGLLSLASLQGGLMSGSGASKARTEAIMLAEAKQEGLRNNIIKTSADPNKSSFDVDLAVVSANDSIIGSNATFTRSWIITNATAPGRKNISVKVTWGTGGVNETVNMVSELVWADPGKATDYSTDGNSLSAKVQSPNNNSSNTDATQFNLGQIIGETALNDGSNLIKYDDNKGHIYLLDSTGKALIKFNGGISHSIKGKVYSGVVSHGTASLLPLTEHPVTFSDLAYCVFPVTSGQSDYICYFGGDCSNGGSNCSSTTNPNLYTAVSGGWYGKVGLLETGTASFHNEKVCFAEDIASNVALTAVTTARFYSTQRLNASNVVVGLEGINQSFACQDFLVVGATGNSNDCHYFSNFSGLSVPSSSVQRSLAPNDNNVSLAENVSSCGTTVTYTIAGGISGDQANLVSVFVNGNSCISTVADSAYSYSCTITTVNTTISLTITATGGNVTPATTALNVSTSQLSITGPTLVANTSIPIITAYHITGVISGNSASQVMLSLTGGICTKSVNSDGVTYTYNCAITSTPTTVTITATGGNVTLATGSVAQVSLADVATVAGPNFVATTAISMAYTISGTITGSYANSVIFTMSNGGSCGNNNDGTYTCAIISLPGTVTIGATGGNVSPDSAIVTLAGVTPVTGPIFNADNLGSCTVTVTGNINQGSGGGAKAPSNGSVTVSYSKSSPIGMGSCSKTAATGNIETYSCIVGSVNNSGQVTISGAKVTVGTPNPVPVSCASTSLILTGPNLTTTN